MTKKNTILSKLVAAQKNGALKKILIEKCLNINLYKIFCLNCPG
jgi:hypothetical protein